MQINHQVGHDRGARKPAGAAEGKGRQTRTRVAKASINF